MCLFDPFLSCIQLETFKLHPAMRVASRKQPAEDLAEESDLTIRTPLVSQATDNGQPSTSLIAQMESDVRDLGSIVQNFAAERDRLLRLVADQASNSKKPETNR